MRKLIKKLKQIVSEIKKKRKEDETKMFYSEINERFCLDEISGKIYILCKGTAVYEAKDGEQAAQIVEKMKEMRQTAIVYKSIRYNK